MTHVEIADLVSKDSPDYESGNGVSRDQRRKLLRFADYLGTGLAAMGAGIIGGTVLGSKLSEGSVDGDLLSVYALGGLVAFSIGAASRFSTAFMRGLNIVYEGEYRGVVDLVRRI